ncbi:MAG: hypothetical protein IJ224_11090 [Lachnospiraceae bacterium]|nr:hypothetical protein [Lachnospiraceae bacterium]
MNNFEINDNKEIKEFLNGLFTEERYDSFYLFSVKLDSAVSYDIDGKINKEFFSEEEFNELTEKEYICWRDIKKTILGFMKDGKLPIKMKLILMFNKDNVNRLIEMNNIPIHPDNVRALFMNVIYSDNRLSITTGTSLNVFTMDKTLEELWDKTVEKYYI